MEVTTVGLDLGEGVFQAHGIAADGTVVCVDLFHFETNCELAAEDRIADRAVLLGGSSVCVLYAQINLASIV